MQICKFIIFSLRISSNNIFHSAGCYFDQIIKSWNSTLFHQVPSSRLLYLENTRTSLEEFVEDITLTVLDTCPQISQAVKHWGKSSLRTHDVIDQNALKVFEVTIKEGIRQTHPLVEKEILKTWESAYETCGSEKG